MTCCLGRPAGQLSRCLDVILHCSTSCREAAEAKAKAEKLKAKDPRAAQKAMDWIKYRECTTPTNGSFLANALGLQKDPSRGRTHIVFRELEYRPKQSKDFRFRFHVVRIGVFKIKDVLKDIELMMQLNPGEGQEYIQDMFENINTDRTERKTMVPILDLTWGDGLQTWMGSSAFFSFCYWKP